MANLRANTIAGSGGSGNNTKASLYLDGTNEYLSFADNADFAMGTGDLTAECWFYVESNVDYRSIIDARAAAGGNGWMIGVKADGNVYVYSQAWLLTTTSAEGTIKTWHHVAYVRKDGTHTLYLDGVSKATSTTSRDYTTQKFAVGTAPYSLGAEEFKGYISSVNLVKGTALYTSNFDPYEVSPKVLSDTVLLCCNDSQKPEAYEVSPVAITPGGTPTPSKFIPSNLAVPTGVVFDGDIKMNSQGHMYFPKGDTSQRGRGRAVIWMGISDGSGSYTNNIDYIQIQTLGNSIRFGDLGNYVGLGAAISSSTRGVFAGGSRPIVSPASGGNQNFLEYVTIATTGGGIDFGGVSTTFRYGAGISNETRGLICGAYQGGGAGGTLNTIQYLTIATTGDTLDFGDMVADGGTGIQGAGATSSSTRGITFGAGTPTTINEMNYITIGTLGNSVDFGDLSAARYLCQGVSNGTRGVVAGGDNSGAVNIIEYITIATTGNATDFGDLSSASEFSGGTGGSNKIRGVFVGRGDWPAVDNAMSYITIASTGNAKDFGDVRSGFENYGSNALSDSHGGLS